MEGLTMTLENELGARREQIREILGDLNENDWCILEHDAENNRALIISSSIISQKPYHETLMPIAWENSSLRRWLNNEFYNSLSMSVKSRIIEVVNQNPDNNANNNSLKDYVTKDKVFLLSFNEFNKYLSNSSAKVRNYRGAKAWWWLRSSGCTPTRAIYVDNRGNDDPFYGLDVDYVGDSSGPLGSGDYDAFGEYSYGGGVCPAFWLALKPEAEVKASQSFDETKMQLNKMISYIETITNGVVLKLDDTKNIALVIAKDIIASMPFNQQHGVFEWADCTLRKWLNGEYFDALPLEARSAVKQTTVQTSDRAQGYAETKDKVFLLSTDEVREYFENDAMRIACFNGEPGWWWLRSPSEDTGSYGEYDASIISEHGNIYNLCVSWDCGVRPAYWLNLNHLDFGREYKAEYTKEKTQTKQRLDEAVVLEEQKRNEANSKRKDEELMRKESVKRNIENEYKRIETKLERINEDENLRKKITEIENVTNSKALDFDESSGRVLVISKTIVAEKHYHDEDEKGITWETSTLRSWLNNDYFASFPKELSNSIAGVTSKNTSIYAEDDTENGPATEDKIFLLGIDEVLKYFSDDYSRIATYNGAPSNWLLRSLRRSGNLAWLVSSDGNPYNYLAFLGPPRVAVYQNGVKMDNSCGVRPAYWIDLSLI